MICTHRKFTCTSDRRGWVWNCLDCGETAPHGYCTRTDCLMEFTRLCHRLEKEARA